MKIVIKISGELFSKADKEAVVGVVQQLKTLAKDNQVGVVLGGGNFFRGAKNKHDFGLTESSAHTIGMLATMANGVLFHDLCTQQGVPAAILSAIQTPSIAQPIRQDTIDNAFRQGKIIFFVGGTGNPFFTTDTNAILRALQIGADVVWKATKVDGVYDADPVTNPNAKKLAEPTYQKVLDKNLGVMDKTAIILAEQHKLPIRVFDIFSNSALTYALENPEFGSTIR